MIKLTVKVRNLVCETNKKIKDKPQAGRKYLQVTCLTKDLHPEYIKNTQDSPIRKQSFQPWLARLSWLGIILQSKRYTVRFLVRAPAWVDGSVPGQGSSKRQPINVSLTLMFLSLSPSLPLSLKINKYNKNKERKPWLVWLSWIECWAANQEVACLIPSQGTCLGYRPGPQLGDVRGSQSAYLSHIGVSLPHFLPPFPSL